MNFKILKKSMKKITIFFALIFSFFIWNSVFAWCTYSEWASLSSFLNDCKPKTVVWASNMEVGDGFKIKLNTWIKNISLVLWVLAVWSLVYAWFLMQFSAWEDELIKKSKNIIKWTIIWFILLISASWIVYVVINVMFWLWS